MYTECVAIEGLGAYLKFRSFFHLFGKKKPYAQVKTKGGINFLCKLKQRFTCTFLIIMVYMAFLKNDG